MTRHRVILREEDICSRTVAGMSIVEVSSIGVARKDYIAHTVSDDAVWVRGNISEELVDIVSDGLGGCSLLGAY